MSLFRSEGFAAVDRHRDRDSVEVAPAAAVARRGASPMLRTRLAAGAFVAVFAILAARMAQIALGAPSPETAERAATASAVEPARRAPLTDREGRLIATTLQTWEVFLRPRRTERAGGLDEATLTALGEVFPRLDLLSLSRELTDGERTFLYIERKASPDQWRRARDLGIVGLEAKPREDRVYPAGRIVAHVVGGVDVDNKGVAGVEAGLEPRIARSGEPLALSIDLRVQAALRKTLSEARSEFAAPGASGLVMDVRTGEIVALVSLPDFDPNDRPEAPRGVDAQAASPTFNKPVQGLFELGSIFKLLTAAMALETGEIGLDSQFNATAPLRRGGFRIDDYRGKRRWMSLREVVRYSSNIGAVRVADVIRPERQEAFFETFGIAGRVALAEMPKGERGRAQLPRKWGRAESATVSYGHGISVTPLHLLTAIASISNDGCRVTPTLLRRDGPPEDCDRVVSSDTSRKVNDLMRLVAEKSSGRSANIPGYEIGGKTGTAYQVKPSGGYDTDKRFNSFLALWPTSEPAYAMLVSLDDPKILDGSRKLPLAGRTAAPTAGRALERIVPLLGLVPRDRFRSVSASGGGEAG